MKKNAYAETTIKATGKRLKHLERNCNTEDPEDVKGFIANKQCSNAYKETLIETYDLLMKSINQEWQKPFYKRYDQLRARAKVTSQRRTHHNNGKNLITTKRKCL